MGMAKTFKKGAINMEALISVIIPVYNTEKYLKKCVESVLSQTYTNLEVYLVDDGSTDSSGTICDKYGEQDSRVKVIHKKNGGQGTARNMALDACSGKYISFVDSDDSIEPDMLQEMLSKLQEEAAYLAICGFIIDNGIRLTEHPKECNEKIYSNEELMKDYVCTDLIFTGPCNKLYRRELFNGIRFPEFRAHEDAFIMHRILGQCKKAVFVGKHLYIQFLREGSTEKSKFSEKKLTLLDCADELLTYYQKYYPQLYQYVAYKKVNEIAIVMADILKSGVYQSQRELYNHLYQEIQKEYEKVKNNGASEKSLSPFAEKALNHPVIFRISSYKTAVIERIKTFIKRLISRIR